MNFRLVTRAYTGATFPAAQGEMEAPFPQTTENNLRIETEILNAVGVVPEDMSIRITVKWWQPKPGRDHDDAIEHVQWYEEHRILAGGVIQKKVYEATQAKQSLEHPAATADRPVLYGIEAEFKRHGGELLDRWESYVWKVAG